MSNARGVGSIIIYSEGAYQLAVRVGPNTCALLGRSGDMPPEMILGAPMCNEM